MKQISLRGQQTALLLVLALLISTLSTYLFYSGKTESLDRFHYDHVQQFSRLSSSGEIVIIEIDDKSLNQLGRWPWARKTHANLLEILHEWETKVIVFDILFPEADKNDHQSDLLFSETIPKKNNVVLPIHYETLDQTGMIVESPPHPLFYGQAASIGHIHLEADDDGIVRSIFLNAGVGKPYWPHISLAALRLTKNLSSQPSSAEYFSSFRSKTESPASSITLSRSHHAFIPMPASDQGIRHISYVDVIDRRIDLSLFKNKIVLIGATATGLGDVLATPIGNMHGVEINAWVIEGLKQKRLIAEIPALYSGVISFVMALILMFILGHLSPKAFLGTWLVSIISITMIPAITILFGNVWFPPSAVLIAIMLFYPLWGWLRAETMLRFLRKEIKHIDLRSAELPARSSTPLEALSYLRKLGFIDTRSLDSTPEGVIAATTLLGSEQLSEGSKFWRRLINIEMQQQNEPAHDNAGIELVTRTIARFSQARYEEQLSRQLIEQSLSGLQDAVCITNVLGSVTYTNQRFEQWFGRRDNLSPNLPLFERLSPLKLKSEKSWLTVFKQLYQSGSAFTDEATLICHPYAENKEEMSFLCQAIIGKAVSDYRDTIIFTFTDISDLKAAERAKSEALNFLSHDLRSPMVSVLAILERTSTASEVTSEDLQTIQTLVSKNLEYADSFLQLSRADAILDSNLVPCDLHAVLDAAQVQANALASPKSIQVKIERCTDDAWVLAEQSLLERAANNLITNAVKFSPENALLTISLEKSPDELRLAVKDQGIGIDPADQGKLFERFTRLSQSSNHGIGLGLSFVSTVCKKFHGKVSVKSKLGRGAVFCIHLPPMSEEELSESL